MRDDAHDYLAVYGTGPRRTSVEGQVDRSFADVFEALLEAIPADDATVELSGLTFLDGYSCAQLHDMLRRRREEGTELKVVSSSSFLRRLWGYCGFDPALLQAA